MYLSPLNILYTCEVNHSDDLVSPDDLDKKVKFLKEKKQVPKLQVFYKDGHYFTLNNAELRVCRKLQNDGFCHRIQVERVPVERIPKGIFEMSVKPKPDVTISFENTTHKSKKGYKQLKTSEKRQSKTEEDKDNDSISSCSVSSAERASEDDINDFLDTDDWVSSTDESTESEVEEEEESFL